MTLPVGVTTCAVTFGKGVLAAGREGAISGRVKLDRPIVHVATGTTLYDVDEEIEASVGGFVSFAVPHVDQAGFVDLNGDAVTDWAYVFTGQVDFGGNRVRNVTRPFQVRVGQAAVDLDLIPGGSITPGVTAPGAAVLSVAGETGVVSADDILGAIEGGLTATFALKDDPLTYSLIFGG